MCSTTTCEEEGTGENDGDNVTCHTQTVVCAQTSKEVKPSFALEGASLPRDQGIDCECWDMVFRSMHDDMAHKALV